MFLTSELPLYHASQEALGQCVQGCLAHQDPLPSIKLPYRGTSLIRSRFPLGPYSGTVPRTLRQIQGGGAFLMSEVPL